MFKSNFNGLAFDSPVGVQDPDTVRTLTQTLTRTEGGQMMCQIGTIDEAPSAANESKADAAVVSDEEKVKREKKEAQAATLAKARAAKASNAAKPAATSIVE